MAKVVDKTQENVKRDQEVKKVVPILGVFFGIFFVATLVIVAMGSGKEKKLIEPKVNDFFSHYDQHNYAYLYESHFCESFKKETRRPKFLKRFETAANNLGNIKSRGKGTWQLGTSEGTDVYMIQFESQYSKGNVSETLTFRKENGSWCVSDYGGTRPTPQTQN